MCYDIDTDWKKLIDTPTGSPSMDSRIPKSHQYHSLLNERKGNQPDLKLKEERMFTRPSEHFIIRLKDSRQFKMTVGPKKVLKKKKEGGYGESITDIEENPLPTEPSTSVTPEAPPVPPNVPEIVDENTTLPWFFYGRYRMWIVVVMVTLSLLITNLALGIRYSETHSQLWIFSTLISLWGCIFIFHPLLLLLFGIMCSKKDDGVCLPNAEKCFGSYDL